MNIADLAELTGKEIACSDWLTIDQEMIDSFADVTSDHQYIHVDVARMKKYFPPGKTIAHGFLTLSLLTTLLASCTPNLEDIATNINYGFNKIRFVSPVYSGDSIRARFFLREIIDKKHGEWHVQYDVTVEASNLDKPVLIAEWLVRLYG
ncbi:MAG: nodulation protein NodN [Acidiferrobacteraceae bacterium]|nr:nodulation protein NodN [Acidiferrobacteraceae bacterium]